MYAKFCVNRETTNNFMRGAHLCRCSRAAEPEPHADIFACRRSFLRERFFRIRSEFQDGDASARFFTPLLLEHPASPHPKARLCGTTKSSLHSFMQGSQCAYPLTRVRE
jgi:hypothetical protein